MPPSQDRFLLRQVGFWLLIVLIGGATGGVAGYVAAKSVAGGLDSRLSQLWSRVTTPVASTTTNSNTQIFPIETVRRPAYPHAFVNRSASPLLPVIRKAGIKLADPIVPPIERIQGYGVSVTSDGWLIAPAGVFTAPVAELGVVWRSRVYPVTQAVRDRTSDLVFFKIDATGLPVTAFVSPLDVVPGLGVWIETQPRQFRPETVVAIDARATREVVVSERLNRRLLVSLDGRVTTPGIAVWAENGGLVGLVMSADATGASVLPTTAISSTLSQSLAGRTVQHAALGIRVQDVSSLVYEGVRQQWPEQGVLVRQVISTSTAKLLQEGDIIERIDRDAFDGIVDLGERLLDYHPGTNVTLQVLRKGVSMQINVPLQATSTGEVLK